MGISQLAHRACSERQGQSKEQSGCCPLSGSSFGKNQEAQEMPGRIHQTDSPVSLRAGQSLGGFACGVAQLERAFGSQRDSSDSAVFGPQRKWGNRAFGSGDSATTSSDVGGLASGLRTAGDSATDGASASKGFEPGNGPQGSPTGGVKARGASVPKRVAPAAASRTFPKSQDGGGECLEAASKVDNGSVSGNKPKGASGTPQAATSVVMLRILWRIKTLRSGETDTMLWQHSGEKVEQRREGMGNG